MKRLVLARMLVTVVGVLVWAYGFRLNEPTVRMVGIVLLAVSLALRFVPRRWVGDEEDRGHREP